MDELSSILLIVQRSLDIKIELKQGLRVQGTIFCGDKNKNSTQPLLLHL